MSAADAFMKEVKQAFAEEERRLIIGAVRVAYQHIMSSWPAYSGYSKANNRISVTGRTIARVEPATRVASAGKYFGKASAVEATELAKLERIEKNFGMKNRTLVIGNAVSYASDVGFSPGAGTHIYETAAIVADAFVAAAAK